VSIGFVEDVQIKVDFCPLFVPPGKTWILCGEAESPFRLTGSLISQSSVSSSFFNPTPFPPVTRPSHPSECICLSCREQRSWSQPFNAMFQHLTPSICGPAAVLWNPNTPRNSVCGDGRIRSHTTLFGMRASQARISTQQLLTGSRATT
jgi:hypothetical protein